LSWCTPNGTKVNYHSKNPKKQYQLFKKMKDSGCYQITFAIESGVQRVLDHVIKKGLPLETVLPTIERAKKAGLFVHTFWVVGNVGETKEEMEKSIEFADRCGADSYSISILSPLPGTHQYRESVEKNLWWTGELDPKDIIYRKSLIKVDGFDNSEKFEAWVNEKNHKLNSRLKTSNPERFEQIYGPNSGARLLVKQT
ncbi:MAG: radical SAM protein, partial [Nanoarchaeota archaeon]